MNKQFSGKVAIVTGGSRGIGAGISRMFGERGANVVIASRSSKAEGDALIAEIKKAGGDAIVVSGDVSKPEDCKKIVDAAVAKFGKVDILVNNAGQGGRKTIDEIDHAYFTLIMETNVLSTIMMSKAVVPHMGEGGRIINISSRLAFIPWVGAAMYCAAKAAVNQITAVFAEELGPKGITVNAVAPGLIETDATRATIPPRKDAVIAATPLRRIGQPDDIAGTVAFFAGEDSKWVTGRCVRCDGGIT
jgi:3-oxoacyl-[acyl-carrier protein] reductase